MTKDLRLKIYPAVIAILGLGLVALLLSRIQIQVVRNEEDVIPVAPVPVEPEVVPSGNQAETEPTPEPTVEPSVSVAPSPQVPTVPTDFQGGLRVRNLTAFPLRVALLPQVSQEDAAQSYSQPVHWDFAPEEGKTKGLMLTLPDRNLKLQSGDVLVAFAQDGSRRYWGPFVVGKTALPTWNGEQQEWLLPLQP